jgi:8-oxo-dGTP pyrophosphatase MutT (NUDIX family)
VSVTERRAVRALILTPDQEVLLLRIQAPQGGDPFWITPGGGMEQDETPEAALRRELAEELGLESFDVGPVVWRRHHTFSWGERRISQREEFRVVHADRFDPVMSDAVEAEMLDAFRWWRVVDLAGAAERLAPPSLAQIVGRYLASGAPETVPDEEVTVD